MTVETSAAATGGGSVDRLPCEWCDEPEMWPDACHEVAGRKYDRCARTIETYCGHGDHRRCAPSSCAVASRWHEPVRTAGVNAAQAIGAAFAVVSTIENRVDVIGTTNDLRQAVAVLRNGRLEHAGVPLGFRGRRLVYVVRSSDGGLF